MNHNKLSSPPLQVVRFEKPIQVRQNPDQFGCCGFTSYGFIQYSDGTTKQVRNPDFNWKKFGK